MSRFARPPRFGWGLETNLLRNEQKLSTFRTTFRTTFRNFMIFRDFPLFDTFLDFPTVLRSKLDKPQWCHSGVTVESQWSPVMTSMESSHGLNGVQSWPYWALLGPTETKLGDTLTTLGDTLTTLGDTLTTFLDFHEKVTIFPFFLIFMKKWQFSHFPKIPFVLRGLVHPDPYHGGAPVVDRPRPHPLPRVPLPMHHHAVRVTAVSRVSQRSNEAHQAWLGYEDRPKIPTCAKLPLLTTKMDTVQNCTFRQKPLLSVRVILKKSIFDVFHEKSVIFRHFLDTSGLWRFLLFYDCQVFPRDLWKSTKCIRKTRKSLKWHFSVKCHRQIWCLRKWLFLHISDTF